MLKKLLFTALLFHFFGKTYAQVVNDTVKFLYGTHTTKLFDQNGVNASKLRYYKKDTVFIPATDGIMLLADSLLTDSMRLVKKRIIGFDTLTKFKKDSILLAYKNRSYRNEYNYFKIDTNVSDIHNYNYIFVKNNIFQNLGMLGTASKPVFYISPVELGVKNGFTIYDHYFTEPKTMHYFNTRSSYTKFEYLANTGDENRIFAEFARNINRFWNVGFSYQRLNSNKQFGKSGRTNDALASNQDFKIFTSGKSKNERYHFMGSFTYFVHKQNEQGGLDRINAKSGPDESPILFDNRVPTNIGGWGGKLLSQQARIEPARIDGSIYSRDRRIVWHFYQQYDALKEGKLSFFHEFDHRNQRIRYQDPFAANAFSVNTIKNPSLEDTLFFYPTKKQTSAIDFGSQFITISQKLGVKTQLQNLVAVAYFKNHKNMYSSVLGAIKGIEIVTNPIETANFFFFRGDSMPVHRTNQNFVGVDLAYYINDSYSVIRLKAEQVVGFSYQSETNLIPKNVGERLLSVSYNYKYFFETGASTLRHSPTFQQLYVQNGLYSWANNHFRGINSTQFYIKSDYKFLKTTKTSLKLSSDLIQDYVYFDTEATPQQAKKAIQLYSLEINLATEKRGFNVENFTRITLKNDPDNLYRVPVFFSSNKFYYRIAPLKKRGKQQILIGIDIRYRSQYKGDAYRPELSTFYLQNDFNLKDMFLVDAFINFKIKNTRVFGRMNQINAFFPGDFFQNNGYYISPYYPSARPFLNIGFSWMLYDN